MSKTTPASRNISIEIVELAKIIAQELKKDDYILHVLGDYEWSFKGKILNGNETLKFRREMCEHFASITNNENKSQIEIDGEKVEWTKAVLEWGGIRGNKEETIIKYSTRSAEYLCNLSEGVSSWSKVLAFQNPAKYYIYDYRVAFAINYILLNQMKRVDQYFYIPHPQGKKLILHIVI
jgi:hypothetical protein